MFVLAGLNHESRCSSPQATMYHPCSCTRITWGIMLHMASLKRTQCCAYSRAGGKHHSQQLRKGMGHFPGWIPTWEVPSSKRRLRCSQPFQPISQASASENPLAAQNSTQLFGGGGRQCHICHPQLPRDQKVKEMSSCLADTGHHTSLITRIIIFWWKSI